MDAMFVRAAAPRREPEKPVNPRRHPGAPPEIRPPHPRRPAPLREPGVPPTPPEGPGVRPGEDPEFEPGEPDEEDE